MFHLIDVDFVLAAAVVLAGEALDDDRLSYHGYCPDCGHQHGLCECG